MQRQSLGSPASRLPPPPIHGAGDNSDDDDDDDDDTKKKKRKKAVVGGGGGEMETEAAGEPSPRYCSGGSAPASSAALRPVHLIPLLTLLCFLVLYLCSREPSAADMVGFGGVRGLIDHAVAGGEIGSRASGSGRMTAPTRGHWSLKELERQDLRLQHHHRRRGWARKPGSWRSQW